MSWDIREHKKAIEELLLGSKPHYRWRDPARGGPYILHLDGLGAYERLLERFDMPRGRAGMVRRGPLSGMVTILERERCWK